MLTTAAPTSTSCIRSRYWRRNAFHARLLGLLGELVGPVARRGARSPRPRSRPTAGSTSSRRQASSAVSGYQAAGSWPASSVAGTSASVGPPESGTGTAPEGLDRIRANGVTHCVAHWASSRIAGLSATPTIVTQGGRHHPPGGGPARAPPAGWSPHRPPTSKSASGTLPVRPCPWQGRVSMGVVGGSSGRPLPGRPMSPLLRAKLRVPVVPDHYVRRERLLRLLDEAVRAP